MAVFQVNSGWTVAPLALPLPVFISYNRTFEVISTGYTPSSRVLYEDNKLTNFSTVIGPNSLLMVDYGILTVAGWQCANIKLQLLQRLATYSCTSTARLAFCNQNLLGDNSGYYQSDARWAVDEATVRQTASIMDINFDGRTAATVLNDLLLNGTAQKECNGTKYKCMHTTHGNFHSGHKFLPAHYIAVCNIFEI